MTEQDSFALKQLLAKLGACSDAAVWCEGKSLQEAWEQCERGDWMLWLCAKMKGEKGWPSHQQVVLAACACAETALKYVLAGEDRPQIAIETARKWANGVATLKEVRSAAATAAAIGTGFMLYAAAAAYAAASAAYAASATNAAYAAYAAASAAYADDYAARENSLKQSADIVRAMLTIPTKV